VAPTPVAGETLYVRRQRDVAAVRGAKTDAWAELLRQPDGMATWLEEVMGLPLGQFVRRNPHLAEDVRSRMLEGITRIRAAPPLTPVEYWAVSERFQGIERAGLVVVNVRVPAERNAAEQLLVDLAAAKGRRAVQRYRWFARQSLAEYGGGGESRRSSRRRAKKGCCPGAPNNTLARAATWDAGMNSCEAALLAAIRGFGM
jgi:hypothetical protein